MDVVRGVGVCRPCGEIVPFSAAIERSEKLFLPEGFRFEESVEGDAYVARVRPNRLLMVPGLFFCAFWDTFMAIWYGIAISHGIWSMALFGLLHLGVGIFLTHSVLSSFLNTRTMHLTRDRFVSKSGPVPFTGHIDLPISEIESFGTIDSSSRTENWTACVNLTNGKSRKLSTGRSDMASAKYVAASLDDALARARRTERVRVEQPFRAPAELADADADSDSDSDSVRATTPSRHRQ